MKKSFLFLFLLFFISCNKDVTLLHINDSHSHIFGTTIHCKYENETYGVDLGGLDLILQQVNEERAKKRNVLFLHAGDLIRGTRYFNQFKGAADIEIMNRALVDAMVLGNHEFDEGEDFLVSLLQKADFPILAANIEFDKESRLKSYVKPYIIVGKWPFKNGIIGVVTPDTAKVSSPGDKIKFVDAAETVERYVKELKKQHINRIFVLSHLGFEEDKKLASRVDGIDVIIGGHSHTLLGFTGLECLPSRGNYPEIVKDPSGRDVLVVQAWEHAKALGELELVFDLYGEIVSYEGSKLLFPIRTKEGVPFPNMLSPFNEFVLVRPSKDLEDFFNKYEKMASEKYSKILGVAKEELRHLGSFKSEIAPLIADSILWKLRKEKIDVDVSLQNAGGVRENIAPGTITFGDVADALPFAGNIVLFKIEGKNLIKALKRGIESNFNNSRKGAFPYLSGVRYEMKGQKAENFQIDFQGSLKEVNPEQYYTVATDSYIAGGGDGYDEFAKIPDKHFTRYIVDDTFAEYISELKEIGRPELNSAALSETDAKN